MGGSGGGSGGGGASPPTYLQYVHLDWLSKTYATEDPLYTSHVTMIELINDALIPANNPFYQKTAFNPDTYLDGILTALTEFGEQAKQIFATVEACRPNVDTAWVVRTTEAVQRLQFESETLPSFERGMADSNGSNGSAFIIGRSIIESTMRRSMDFVASDVAYKAEFERYRTAVELCFKDLAWEQEWRTRNAQYFFDYWKLCIVAGMDSYNQQMSWWEAERRWPLDVYQHGANLLAAVSGGTVPTPNRQANVMASTIGSALSGSYAGYQIGKEAGGAYWGAGIGAVVGGLAGYLSSK